MSREERLARDVVDLVDRFRDRGTPDRGHGRAGDLLRAAVPVAVNGLVLLSAARGLRSRRRRLMPLALVYLERRARRSRKRHHR
jgi:hypothetical protein